MKTSRIVIIVLAFIFIAFCMYYWCDSYKVKVKYYYSPGCPHCRNFMSEWTKFSSKGGAKFTKVNCQESNECAGIRGVPHVTFESDKNGVVVYSGDRTSDSLSDFLTRFSL